MPSDRQSGSLLTMLAAPFSKLRALASRSILARRVVRIIARCGYVAKGVVYMIVGVLASLAAAGLGGSSVNTKQAITQLASQPFGGLMLALLSLGLLAYAVWRLLQALIDTENLGYGVRAIAARLGFLVSSGIYSGLALYSFNLLRNAATGNTSPTGRTAELMSHPGGIYLVFAVGVVFFGVGVRQIVRAVKCSFLKNWHMREMNERQRKLAKWATRMGLTARGIVFLLIGLFLCLAAWQSDPSEAEGLGGALATLAQQPLGPWLLGIVSLGLVAYGIYCFINARFRDVSA
ncbi:MULTISPECIES: DUF1206 domain-containing protein [Halomonadaceae]|nr:MULTISPECIES: DUF1206 domain-containing protein [Halomonas]MCD6008117.1 DUF1206 domain-containing protein [Halomonas sp. IOP_31]MEA3250217.1 DUF1206 domain-containing protein [Pseudomonadota bacterium]